MSEGNCLAGAFREQATLGRVGGKETSSSFAAMTSESAVKSLVPDGGLEKTILQPGDGEPAGKSALVSLRYSMKLQDSPGDEPFDSSANRRNGILRFRLGNRKVIPAVELIAESMAVGEECEVVCSPAYAFGERGLKRKGVPPNATIVIRAEMVALEGAVPKKVFEDMTPVERFSEATEYKERGNKLFKETKFEKAIAEYSKAIKFLVKVLDDPPAAPKANEVVSETEQKEAKGDAADESPAFESADAATSAENAADVELNNEQAASDHAAGVVKNEIGDEDDEHVPVIDATEEESSVAGAPLAPETSTVTNDEEGFQGAQVVDESAKEATTAEDSQEKAVEDPKPDAVDGISVAEVRDMHVKTLNNLSLCCIKIGQFGSAEQASTIAIHMDALNSKAFYNR